MNDNITNSIRHDTKIAKPYIKRQLLRQNRGRRSELSRSKKIRHTKN